MNFFLGTLYVCNGGRILTVVRAQLISDISQTVTKVIPNRRKTFISINHRRKSISQCYTLIDMSLRHAPVCEGKNFKWAELHICTLVIKPTLLAVPEI